jgi:hypothetical protein
MPGLVMSYGPNLLEEKSQHFLGVNDEWKEVVQLKA